MFHIFSRKCSKRSASCFGYYYLHMRIKKFYFVLVFDDFSLLKVYQKFSKILRYLVIPQILIYFFPISCFLYYSFHYLYVCCWDLIQGIQQCKIFGSFFILLKGYKFFENLTFAESQRSILTFVPVFWLLQTRLNFYKQN